MIVIELVLDAKLMQHVLRSLNRTGYELGIEHNIQSVDAKMTLRLLFAPVDFDCVTERLKCVERQADGQQQIESGQAITQTESVEACGHIFVEKIIVFKNGQQSQISYQTNGQQQLSLPSLSFFHRSGGKKVNQNYEKQYKNVLGNPGHVESAAGYEQQQPTQVCGRQEIERRYQREEE